MRIGILSDSHDQRQRTARAVALLVDQGAEALVHCGDLPSPGVVHECGLLPAYFVLGCAHAILYWLTVSFLTPFVLLVGFFNPRGRLLHDILIGTVVINNPARAQAIRRP